MARWPVGYELICLGERRSELGGVETVLSYLKEITIGEILF